MWKVAAAVAQEIAPKFSLFILTQAKCTWIYLRLCVVLCCQDPPAVAVFLKGPPTYVSLASLFLSPSSTIVPSICLSFSLWLRHFILRFLALQASSCDL